MAIALGRDTAPGGNAPGPFIRKPVERLAEEAQDGDGLQRSVGALDLTALGIGGIIGTGIFVIVGEAIGTSGPAIILSFLLAGVTCLFSALSYSELASAMPVSGSAYSYGYATMGEIVAWIIGWDLLIEYGFSVATVAVGWGGYLKDLLDSVLGLALPTAIALPPGQGGSFNLPAVVLVAATTAVLCLGVREGAKTNTVMVFAKLAILLFFVIIGVTHFTGSHFDDFAPHGMSGTWDAAALIFFAYIGFDAVSTAGGESRDPGRDMPRAIVGSLLICTLVYIAVAIAAIGLLPASGLNGADAPLTDAVKQGAGIGWAGDILSLGALIAIASVVLTITFGQSRIAYAMSRDGLLPRGLAKLSARKVPVRLLLGFGVLIAAMAAFIPLKELAELVNIGTLFAFLIVNVGVIVLRRTQPDMERRFKVPLVPLFPLIGAALCVYLMTKLQAATWWRFGIWLALGMVVYATYGRTHSVLRREAQAGT